MSDRTARVWAYNKVGWTLMRIRAAWGSRNPVAKRRCTVDGSPTGVSDVPAEAFRTQAGPAVRFEEPCCRARFRYSGPGGVAAAGGGEAAMLDGACAGLGILPSKMRRRMPGASTDKGFTLMSG